MLHPIGAAPDNLPGRPSDATIVGSTLCANQKAAQYVLLTVPSDLSFACVFVYITEFTLLALRHEEAPEVNNTAKILPIGEHVIDNWAVYRSFPCGEGIRSLKRKSAIHTRLSPSRYC